VTENNKELRGPRHLSVMNKKKKKKRTPGPRCVAMPS
jgi:hypothetical protein